MCLKPIRLSLFLLTIFLVFNCFTPVSTPSAQSVDRNLIVDGAIVYQTINGVGTNIDSWAWKGGELRPAIDKLVDILGHNLFRVVYDPMDWAGNGSTRPAVLLTHLQNLDPATLIEVYEAPRMQGLWGTIGYLNSKGISGDQIIVNFMGWTAPWMGGSGTFGIPSFIYDNEQTNQDMATMIASLVYYGHHRRDVSGSNQNLSFGYIAPFNEIDYNGLEGPWMNGVQLNAIYEDIITTLNAMGDTTTRVIGPDTAGNPDPYTNDLSPAALARIPHLSFHAYSVNPVYPATARAGIRADWLTETSVWCEECNNNLLPSQGEWTYGAGIGDIILGDIENGFSAVLSWEGLDGFYYHDNGYTAWGHLGCTQNGGGCTSSDIYPREYAIRSRAWPQATIAKAVRPGMVRRGLSTTLPNLKALAFYTDGKKDFSIVGHNQGISEIKIEGELQNLPEIPLLSLYLTNASTNLQRMENVAVTGNLFSVTIPADTFFALIYPRPLSPFTYFPLIYQK